VRAFLENGMLELYNKTAERVTRPAALGRKNWLFAGFEAGGKAAAIAYTLIETAKLDGVDPKPGSQTIIARTPDYRKG
jgi:transposase